MKKEKKKGKLVQLIQIMHMKLAATCWQQEISKKLYASIPSVIISSRIHGIFLYNADWTQVCHHKFLVDAP